MVDPLGLFEALHYRWPHVDWQVVMRVRFEDDRYMVRIKIQVTGFAPIVIHKLAIQLAGLSASNLIAEYDYLLSNFAAHPTENQND